MITSEHITGLFKKEFSFIVEKFEIITFPVTNIPKDKNPYRAGVYIFFRGERIWKVGKSNDNAIKRALQHFAEDTGCRIGKGMRIFEKDSDMYILLFLLKEPSDLHWVFALECYFEMQFRRDKILEIQSARIG